MKLLLILGVSLVWSQVALANDEEVGGILQAYAVDYLQDKQQLNTTFGIEVAGEMWHVVSTKADEQADSSVVLKAGPAPEPTYYFTIDTIENLRKIDRGDMNAMTAAARAMSTDYAPLDVSVMEGYQPGPEFMTEMFSVFFHFWTKGAPEVIPFGANKTRKAHGGNVAVLFYQPGFRSAWVNLGPGDHVNEDPEMQVNDFPSLLIITSGTGKARIDGREIDIRPNEAILIPPGITHEFWNPGDAAIEGILVMFGEGA